MVSLLVGIAAGAAVLGLCILLRWTPSSLAGKVALGAYLLLSGAWAGARWARVHGEEQAGISAVTAEKVAAVTGRFLPPEGTATGKMSEQEGEKTISEVAETTLRGILPAADIATLRDALLGEAAGRRLTDKDGYIKRERMRRYLYTEVPDILEVRLQGMTGNKRVQIFGTGFLLLVIGVIGGAMARQMGRHARLPEE